MTMRSEAGLFVAPVNINSRPRLDRPSPGPKDVRRAHAGSADERFAGLLNRSLRKFYWDAVKTALRNPAQALFFLRTVGWQRRARRIRQAHARQGVHVPPILLYSITSRCNLRCKGCYHQSLRGAAGQELSGEEVKRVIDEATALGISFIVLAGGEPLVRPETLEVAAAHPDTLFLIFTNGLLIDDQVAGRLKHLRNVIPLISMEGYQADTDKRRGSGVSARIAETVARLRNNHIFWGTSVTVTTGNFGAVTGEAFVKGLRRLGAKMFLYVEYSPVVEGTEDWVITNRQREILAARLDGFRSEHAALFVGVPGDEKDFGGCLAAGRGFVHISADGNVEPCPFVPYSDANLRHTSLKAALQSRFLATVRHSSGRFEGEGGCALWKERAWLESLLAGKEGGAVTIEKLLDAPPPVRRLPGNRVVRIARHQKTLVATGDGR